MIDSVAEFCIRFKLAYDPDRGVVITKKPFFVHKCMTEHYKLVKEYTEKKIDASKFREAIQSITARVDSKELVGELGKVDVDEDGEAVDDDNLATHRVVTPPNQAFKMGTTNAGGRRSGRSQLAASEETKVAPPTTATPSNSKSSRLQVYAANQPNKKRKKRASS